MPVIQISKIQLRRGPQTELPGAPTSLSPLTFADGLDSAEMGFTTDTGRLFIGHEPSVGHANYQRATFPYQNIEVLTENSTDALRAMVGRQMRELGEEAFITAPLGVTGSSWISVPDPADSNAPFKIFFEDGIALSIEYGVYGADNKPVRIGCMKVVHDDAVLEPYVTDEAVASRRFAAASDGGYDPAVNFHHVDIRVVAGGPSNNRYLYLEYHNNTVSDTFTLRFRLTRPLA